MLIPKKLSSFTLTLATFSFLILAIFSLSSCQKETIESMDNPAVEVITEMTASSRSKTDCLEGVRSKGGVLIFQDTEHFTDIYNCLKEQYQQNITEFVRPLEEKELAEEEIIALAIKKKFNTAAPLVEFEKAQGQGRFLSLRQSLAEREQEWLASEELHEEKDPYANLPVDKFLATMLNPKMEVMIGKKLVITDGKVTGRSACLSYHAKAGVKYCSSKKKFYGKQFLINLPFGTFSMVGGNTKAYRRVFGKWWPAIFTRVYTHKFGYVYRRNCESIRLINNTTTWSYFFTTNIQFYAENTKHRPIKNHIRTRHYTTWCSNLLYLTN